MKRINGLVIGLVLAAILVTPVLADDGITPTGPVWIGILQRVNVNEPDNVISNTLGGLIPDWARQGTTGGVPAGTGLYWQDTDDCSYFSCWASGGGFYQIDSLALNKTKPYYIVAQGNDDLVGEGTWTYTLRLLNGETHTGSITKTDYTTLGIGWASVNLTLDDGRHFNTTMGLPHIFGIGTGAYITQWTMAYNANTKSWSVIYYDDTRYIEMFPGSINNPPVYIRWDGPGPLKARFWFADNNGLVFASRRTIQGPGQSLITTFQKIGASILTIVTTLWTLFDWLVIKANFVFVLLIMEFGPAAYFMFTSKDIFQWFQKMFRVNKEMFLFFSTFFRNILQIGITLILLLAAALNTAAGLVVGLIGMLI